jgi:hypothetical protein
MLRAVVNSAVALAAVTLVAAGCNSGSPTGPQSLTAREVSGIITFANAGPESAPISTYSESAFVVQFRSGTWQVWTNYGNPAPFPIFMAPAGARLTGEVHVTAGGAEFSFKSVDVYSSTTPIPYAIVGTRDGAKQIEIADTLPATGVVGNTFGAFRTVMNPSPGRLVDTLTLTLTNPAEPCCINPMGLDNIVLVR